MIGLVLLVMIFAVGSVSAAALDNTHMGTKANAMGKAFTGLADDASAVFYNPAGLVFQDKGMAVQVYDLQGFTDLSYSIVTNPAADISSDENFTFPGFFMNYNKGDMAFGLGVYIPYGGGKYKYENFTGYQMTVEQSLGLVAFGGSMAVKLSEKLGLGLSLTGYYGTFSLKYSDSLDPSINSEKDLSGIAAVGGNLGFMYKPTEKLSLGLTVKLPVRITIDGTMAQTNVIKDASAELRLPWYFTVGAAFKASEALTLTFDVNYATYSSMEIYTLITDGLAEDTTTYYKDAFYFALGADFKASETLSIRGGITFTPNATEDAGLSLSADVSHLIFGLGLEYEVIKGFSLSLSGHYLMGFDRTVTDSSLPVGTTEQIFHKSVVMFMAGLNFKL